MVPVACERTGVVMSRKIVLADLPEPRMPRRLWKPATHADHDRGPDRAGRGVDDGLATFLTVRPRLFGIAYRMLGSVADAEDLVQEVWLRWQHYERDRVREPAAFLATTTTRMAINELQSARARRESYIGPWLPEPIDTGQNPELAAENDETLQLAVLFLLERLTPAERAAYVLREAFDAPYSEIAETIDTTEPNARQLVSRARRHLAEQRGTQVSASEQRRFMTAFLDAARSGDLERLESLLADDVVTWADGDGKGNAARIPVAGRERVAKFLMAFGAWLWELVDVRFVEANNRLGCLLIYQGVPFAMVTVTATVHGIDRMYWMMNPAKLGGVVYTFRDADDA